MCSVALGVLQRVVFTELAAYCSSGVVRECFVSSEARESVASPQNYRYSQGVPMHVGECMHINTTGLLEFISPQDSLSSLAWNIYLEF